MSGAGDGGRISDGQIDTDLYGKYDTSSRALAAQVGGDVGVAILTAVRLLPTVWAAHLAGAALLFSRLLSLTSVQETAAASAITGRHMATPPTTAPTPLCPALQASLMRTSRRDPHRGTHRMDGAMALATSVPSSALNPLLWQTAAGSPNATLAGGSYGPDLGLGPGLGGGAGGMGMGMGGGPGGFGERADGGGLMHACSRRYQSSPGIDGSIPPVPTTSRYTGAAGAAGGGMASGMGMGMGGHRDRDVSPNSRNYAGGGITGRANLGLSAGLAGLSAGLAGLGGGGRRARDQWDQ